MTSVNPRSRLPTEPGADLEMRQARGEMIEEILSRSGRVVLATYGRSMRYLIKSGSLVSVVGVSVGALRLGDVVLLKTRRGRAGYFMVHRVIRIRRGPEGVTLVTRGDSSPRDPERWTEETCLGKVTAVSTEGEVIRIDGPLWRLLNLVAARLSRFSVYFNGRWMFLRRGNPHRQILPQRLANSALKRLLRVGGRFSRSRDPSGELVESAA